MHCMALNEEAAAQSEGDDTYDARTPRERERVKERKERKE